MTSIDASGFVAASLSSSAFHYFERLSFFFFLGKGTRAIARIDAGVSRLRVLMTESL